MDVIQQLAEPANFFRMGGVFIPRIIKADGRIIDCEPSPNIVVNGGIQEVFDNGIAGTTWYVGLLGNDTPAATTAIGDINTNEVTEYDETVRQTWVDVRTNQTVTNSASPAVFTIDTNSTTVYGAFVVSNSTKGGSSGTLLAAALFTGGSKSLDDDDQLSITYSLTGSSS